MNENYNNSNISSTSSILLEIRKTADRYDVPGDFVDVKDRRV